jgi:hypothetical protein
MRGVQVKHRIPLPVASDFYQVHDRFVLDEMNAHVVACGHFLCSASAYVERAFLRSV